MYRVPGWWNGRHEGLKILCPLKKRAGSSPAPGTRIQKEITSLSPFIFMSPISYISWRNLKRVLFA